MERELLAATNRTRTRPVCRAALEEILTGSRGPQPGHAAAGVRRARLALDGPSLDRLRAARVTHRGARERGAGLLAREALRELMNSPAHRENILGHDVTEIGWASPAMHARRPPCAGDPAVHPTGDTLRRRHRPARCCGESGAVASRRPGAAGRWTASWVASRRPTCGRSSRTGASRIARSRAVARPRAASRPVPARRGLQVRLASIAGLEGRRRSSASGTRTSASAWRRWTDRW